VSRSQLLGSELLQKRLSCQINLWNVELLQDNPPLLTLPPMSTNYEPQPSTHQKTLTIDSATAHSDEYPGFIKTTSPRGLKTDTDSDSFLDEDIIPPNHTHRTLVLCFDGTGGSVSSLHGGLLMIVYLVNKGDQFDEDVSDSIDQNLCLN
jgi:hypothetical protein